MIKLEKITCALYALHLVLVRARFMAQTGHALDDIAGLLDYAEALPRLLAADEDMTNTYREYLVGLTEQFPHCRYILQKFDDPHPLLTW